MNEERKTDEETYEIANRLDILLKASKSSTSIVWHYCRLMQ